MAGANSEQLKAIEHEGGVLLKAGAGSGKTFVLKEHMIYLTGKWIKSYISEESIISFDSYIKSKYLKVVMMTFTKKAAGEISIRLFDEFDQMADSVDEDIKGFWKIACEQLDYLTVTTIHGFCFKLIKQGFFPEIDVDEDVVSYTEYQEIITKIFDRWIDGELEKNNPADAQFVDMLLKDKEQVLSSILSIFGDPTLRRMWSKLSIDQLDNSDSDKVVEDLFDILGINQVFEGFISISDYDEFEKKPWFEFLKQFDQVNEGKVNSLAKLIKYNEFFSGIAYKIPSTPRAKGVDEQVKSFYTGVRDLNKYLKANGEDFAMFREHGDDLVKGWYQKFNSLVQYVDREYTNTPGITFSDLEYIVSEGLEDESTIDRIAESYEYLIVDEFQDTSHIQFEILSRIIKRNFNKLFCVGDIKQAIYGFRGGELGVFLDCEKLVPQVLSLKNNYRSDKDIIEFNNNFFDFLFRTGLKYEGNDIRPVEVEYQEAPIPERSSGEVYQIRSDVSFLIDEGLNKISNNEVDYLESLALINNIERLLETDSGDVCILYKKLKPSLLLIGLMIQKDVGFTAQVKVPFGEDPIIGLFQTLIEKKYNKNKNSDQYCHLIMRAYLGLMGISIPKEDDYLTGLIDKFTSDTHYFGLYRAFYNILANLGVANSNYGNNISHINVLCSLANDNTEKVMSLLNGQSSSAYSLDFQYGKNAQNVVIMTTHASKGLQFSHVLLGGIFTNDKSMPATHLFGKFPGSFKWGKNITDKKKYKTPEYFYENEVTKHKDFSESKRLFYVAGTRAVNSLGWVQLDYGEVKSRKQSGSWQNGIQSWMSSGYTNSNEIMSKIHHNSIEVDLKKYFSHEFLEASSNRLPLFHIDNVGIQPKLGSSDSLILPELSVTRIATVVDCPRKFYLKNICKISEEDLELLQGKDVVTMATDFDDNAQGLSSKSFSGNTAARGIRLHDHMNQVIINNFEYPEDLTKTDKNTISWAVDKLITYKENFMLISEQPIKFEVFDYMISGIPDLILLPKDKSNTEHSAEVWDYKSGNRQADKELPYVFQLMCYGYALYHLGMIEQESQIKLVLCYLDEKEVVEQNISLSDVENYLNSYWKQLARPDLVNTDHCEKCSYGNICHR